MADPEGDSKSAADPHYLYGSYYGHYPYVSSYTYSRPVYGYASYGYGYPYYGYGYG